MLGAAALSAVVLIAQRRSPPFAIAVLFFAIGLVSEAAFADDTLGNAVFLSSAATLVIYLLTVALDVANARRIVFWTTVAGCVAYTASIFLLWAIEPYPKTTATSEWLHDIVHPWASSTWATRTDFLSLNTALPPLLFLLSFALAAAPRAPRVRAAAGLATGALVIAIAICDSRAGLLAAGTAIVVLGMLTGGRGSLRLGLAGVAGILVGTVAGIADPSSLATRVELWRVSLDALLAHVPLGIGPGGFPALFAETIAPTTIDRRVPVAPHELFFDVWGNAGVLGLTALLLLAAGVSRRVRRPSWTPWSAGAVAVIASTIAFGLFESDLGSTYPTAAGAFTYIASPLPWVALALFADDAP